MAVTVEALPSLVLDDAYRVVSFNAAAAPAFAEHLGRNVFEPFPGSQPLFEPYYDKARRTGETVEFAQYFDGYVMRLRVDPIEDGLEVSWDVLAILDTWTIDGLRSSIEEALAKLDAAGGALERDRVRQSLRLVREHVP